MLSAEKIQTGKEMNKIATAAIFLISILFSSVFPVSAFAFQCADVTEIPTTECEALVDLYNSTDGANWNDNTGWLADNTPCDWFGVTCRDGQIVYLMLNENGLQGNIPETIGNFSMLEYLNLDANELAGSIPAGIGQLTVLDQLRLGDNQLTTIPDAVGQCSALTFLDLGKNQISDLPSQIGALSKLNYLKLSSNQLTSASFPAEFSNLAALETLDLFGNSLTSLPASVSDLTNLKGINLGWNKPLESLAGIGKMTGLENLYLHSTELSELPEEIASLSKLKELWLKGNLFTQFPSVVTQLTALETLLLTYNPQMTGELPLSLVDLTQMQEFKFDSTGLCVPADAGLQAWLAGINTVASSNKECIVASVELEKAMKVMRMLTGHEGTCTDLDADGDGKVAAGDAVLALRKAANISDMTCGEDWTIIGDIPEFSFSSEPIIDENTTFTMNVDPFDQLMLTAVTTNSWTIEYFAVKDAMGIPVFLTEIHAKKDENGEYLEVELDGNGHPISIEKQGGKKIVLNWENCTIYGEKDWETIGELLDFSSISSPVIDDQAKVFGNDDPDDPLWFRITTSDEWNVKYFGTKNIDGSLLRMTFIHAVNSLTDEVIMAEINKYGEVDTVSKQDGKIMKINWASHTLTVQDGILYPPSKSLSTTNKHTLLSNESKCYNRTSTATKLCPLFGIIGIKIPVLGDLLSLHCSVTSLVLEEGFCNNSPNPKKVACLIGFQLASTVVGIGSALGGPLTGFLGSLVGTALGTLGDVMCEKWYGNSSGDPHLRTFDGLGYDFQAVGEFVYLQSTQDPTEMTIQIRQGPWATSKNIAANKAVAMSVGGDIVEINVAKTPRLSINTAPVTVEDGEIIQLSNGCKIYAETQRKYWVIWKDNSTAEVRTYGGHLDISVSLPDNRKGFVKGLLGNHDGEKTNDLQTRDGSKIFDISTELTKDELYNQFGNSWRITKDESLFSYAAGEDTSTYTDLNFPYELVTADDLSETVRADAEQICRDAGITDPILLQDCILDVGMTDDPTFADNMTDLTPPEQTVTVTDDWLLYEDAQKTEGDKIIHITPDETWKTGMALREGALNLDGSFEKTFSIYMGDNDNGADGMIFIMLPELPPAGTSLNGGEGLGFSSACNSNPCLGVEIDTYRNSTDPSEDHLALVKNGSIRHNSTENATLPLVPLAFNIEDNATHTLTVSWNKEAQVLSVVLDGSTVIAHAGLDLKTLLGTSTASYGFVGATGGATSEQYFYPVTTLQQP